MHMRVHLLFLQGSGLMLTCEHHRPSSNEEKMQWARSLSSQEAQDAMPNYLGWMHFNYDKFENGRRVDFKLVDPSKSLGSGINQQFLSFFTGK